MVECTPIKDLQLFCEVARVGRPTTTNKIVASPLIVASTNSMKLLYVVRRNLDDAHFK